MVVDDRWLPEAAQRSDRELWLRLKQDCDPDAFADLFRRHSDLVYNFCFRRLSSWSSAEDATQQVATSLWHKARTGDIDELRLESARPVLMAMARDVCSNLIRSRRRGLTLVDRLHHTHEASAEDNISAWVDDESRMVAIRTELDRLPAKHREVIELVIWSELSVAEAAATLRIPAGTVKSRLARARAALAESALLAEVVTDE